MKTINRIFLILALALLPSLAAHAQLNTPVQTIALNYNVAESLTLTLSTNQLTLAQVPSYGTVNVTVAYSFAQTRTISVDAWFSNPSAALSAGANVIPSSDIMSYSQAGNPTQNVPCVQPTDGVAGAVAGGVCYAIMNAPLGGAINGSGTLKLSESLAIATGTYPAGNYVGTLNIGASAL